MDLGKLESALAAPQRGHEPYPELADKAAILLYSLAKTHAWANGNKRMAFVATLMFLGLNNHWWDASGEEARIHVTFAAASDARCFQQAVAYLRAYFRRKIVSAALALPPPAGSPPGELVE